jgi:hypothetical protein
MTLLAKAIWNVPTAEGTLKPTGWELEVRLPA